MTHRIRLKEVAWALAAFALAAALAAAQEASTVTVTITRRALAANVVLPQRAAFAVRPGPRVEITEVRAGVVIDEQVATTTLDVALRNAGGSRAEAELLVPVPDGAVVRSFTFEGAGKEPSAAVLPKDEARRTYDAIVAKVRDPALLEFVGYNLVRSSVFPVEAGGSQKVRLTYEHVLAADGDRVDYVLPRTEALDYRVPWKVTVKVKSKRAISTVYSPTHRLVTERSGAGSVSAQVADDATTAPGPFRLSYLLERNGVTATLFAYPDPKAGGGYFLLLAGLPAAPKETARPAIPREVTLVLDRSGSMRGEKLNQVREAALQILSGLAEGEGFNIITYQSAVESFAPAPVRKTKATVEEAAAYLRGVNAIGGTNIYDALIEALRPKPLEGTLPIVLFLTDGLPTVGRTSEAEIRDLAIKGNAHQRRIFTFGVGVDVNTPLLEKIAAETRAVPTFVLPNEDVEAKVGQVFRRLSGPVLADPILSVQAPAKAGPPRVRELLPARLPDLFEGDQLVLLGQYVGDAPLAFGLTGNYRGAKRTFEFSFPLDNATTRNAFVPRLWASRKIAELVDAVRQLGADGGGFSSRPDPAHDARLKELVDEIIRLSTEFGILTEYTAFLAREGTDLSLRDDVLREAERNFKTRAIQTRSGLSSMNQDINNGAQRQQFVLNGRNGYFDANMNRVAIANVQQVSDRAFYNRNGRWVDSRIVNEEGRVRPEREIEFGSEEFRALAVRLAEEGRQGTVALRGDILMLVDGRTVLVKAPADGAPVHSQMGR